MVAPRINSPQENAMQPTSVQGHTLFQMLHPEQVKAISDAAEEIVLEPGSPVYRHGDRADFLYVVREGAVALRRNWVGGVGLHVDEVKPGEVFGACICFGRDTYMLDAQCEQRTKLLRIRAETLKRLLDGDLRLGYTVQGYLSGVYYRRYIEAISKLQAVVHSLPLAPRDEEAAIAGRLTGRSPRTGRGEASGG
jgi:CRP/FNR family transcriptional regulator, cyclic AMP receptor protein